MVAHVHPDCINATNPYHECTDYCFKKIAERKAVASSAPSVQVKEAGPLLPVFGDLPKEFGKQQLLKKRQKTGDEAYVAGKGSKSRCAPPSHVVSEDDAEDADDTKKEPPSIFARPIDSVAGGSGGRGGEEEDEEAGRGEGREGGRGGDGRQPELREAPSYENMSARERKLYELRMKLGQARMANQMAVTSEKRREDKPAEEAERPTRGMSKAKWFEEKKKKMGKVLEANGLDMSTAYMLDTQEAAEEKYKKAEKKEAAFGWDVFNQQSLYTAYKKRTSNIPTTMDEYNEMKEKDPDFYRDGGCLEYGKTPDIPDENIDRMVAELNDRGKKRKEFSRRRRFHDEKDIDSINDRNEHFNRKIERAFGKYTAEIRNNLERGTALPD